MREDPRRFAAQFCHGDAAIHLLSNPAIINHEAVNAFQCYSSVILQRSIRKALA